jgi:hypothetical protein
MGRVPAAWGDEIMTSVQVREAVVVSQNELSRAVALVGPKRA